MNTRWISTSRKPGPNPQGSKYDWEEIQKMYLDGVAVWDIRERLGCSEIVIKNALKEGNIPLRTGEKE